MCMVVGKCCQGRRVSYVPVDCDRKWGAGVCRMLHADRALVKYFVDVTG